MDYLYVFSSFGYRAYFDPLFVYLEDFSVKKGEIMFYVGELNTYIVSNYT